MAAQLATAPFNAAVVPSAGDCSFGLLVARPIQLFMFCAVYGPGALILLICYGYIYFVARGHARAILEVRHSLHGAGLSGPPRYGLALAITTGMFLALWIPFQACMLMDVFVGTNILSEWVTVYLALPILASSAFNPWVYGYRNAELRSAVRRVVDDFLTALGFTYRSHQTSDPAAPSGAATVGDHASFIHHVQRDYFSHKPAGDFLLVPIARPESSDIESEPTRVFKEIPPRIIISGDRPITLKGSRSMIESFAVSRGSDIVIIKNGSCGMMHGASVV
ncbi:histamine receptor-related g-protein coupled receptor [Holotrichia oblita]|uniref:Histamine receptor-related g-protein coupled receptor n=1 Tax=Holotrichia oblita TaxID=644536 RepID=A0ACB9TNU0_HOLOL|nr:histamine receptor-related g-protein coupled receptor [Holotrichia oblita]